MEVIRMSYEDYLKEGFEDEWEGLGHEGFADEFDGF